MSMNYAAMISPKTTPVTQPLMSRESEMTENNTGGFTFQLDKWGQFTRFLILGTEGGSYYVGEKELTVQNAKVVIECIKEDPSKALSLIKSVSLEGRAAKQNPTIFALALLATHNTDTKLVPEIKNAVTEVCRTATMLFMYTKYIKTLRGFGPSVRKSLAKFYLSKDVKSLDYQVVKYRNREGFTHKDMLRLCHPKTTDALKNDYFKYIAGKGPAPMGTLANTYETIKALDNTPENLKVILRAISEEKMPREGIPNVFFNNISVWEAMLPMMPITGLIRNLAKMTSLGMFNSNFSESAKIVVEKLKNPELIKSSRVHPFNVLIALKTYSRGHGDKGSLTWTPNPKIVGALNDCFKLSFQNVEKTGKNILVCLDVSGSMESPCMGSNIIQNNEAAAALAWYYTRTEENVEVMAFGSKKGFKTTFEKKDHKRTTWGYRDEGMAQVPIHENESLESVTDKLRHWNFGATDASLAITYALEKKLPVDTFIVITDNEVNSGVHPSAKLNEFRKKINPKAKLVVMGMATNGFTIADPKDSGMLDVVGFDASVPVVVGNFMRD
jgi:60 kDa SS-A/Ro ribonucleoprotein